MLLQDVTADAVRRHDLERECETSRAELGRLGRQNDELLERQRALLEANAELTAANNDLRSTNEHLLIAAEEAEAAAEEVETLNEEMQATSEELETLNEELQATVEELNTTNEELGARGDEMERVANERRQRLENSEQQRMALAEALRHVPVAAALIDDSGVVRHTSHLYERLASGNHRLPLPGQQWVEKRGSVELNTDGEISYEITALPVNDDSKLVVLHAKPEDGRPANR